MSDRSETGSGAAASLVVTPQSDVGPQRPATSTPALSPGTIRRTSNVDVLRAGARTDRISVSACARDLATDPEGVPRVLGRLTLRASLLPSQELESIETDPAHLGLDELVGRTVGVGFRGAAVAAVPAARRDADLLYLLLDDLPVATLVSGYALQRAGLVSGVPREMFAPTVDLCAGWQAGGTLMQVIDTNGMPPMTMGPPAPVLERPGEPDGWHEIDGSPVPRTVRRRRRIDVTVGDELVVDAMFRDSHFDDDGHESVVHEYALRATIDRASLEITSAEATPNVLPYVECPAAAASATRLAGLRLDAVRDLVRREFVGTTTCTHLNDLLRSLEDVRGMLASR